MKKIILVAMLLLPLAAICQQQVSKEDMIDTYDLKMADVMAFYAKDSIDQAEVIRDLDMLNTILNKDIGEEAMIEQLKEMDPIKDSVAFQDLVKTRPSQLYQQKRIMKQTFVEAHPDSYVSLYVLEENNGMYSASSYAIAFDKLSDRIKKTAAAGRIRERILALQELMPPGTQVPDFTRQDQYGKTIKLSDYKGKLVLLDFWGSWCGACRQSHPHVRRLYEAYKGKGLEIIGIANEYVHGQKSALDKCKATWLEAIKKDSANWIQVMNDEGTGDVDIVKAYHISSYPTKILLDKDGKVLLRITDMQNVEIEETIRRLLN